MRHIHAFAAALAGGCVCGEAAALTPEEVFQRVAPSVGIVIVLDSAGNPVGQGSGVVVADRRVVTNRHVIRNAAGIKVLVAKAPHTVTNTQCDSRGRDLCLLEVPSLTAPAAEFRDPDTLAVGQPAFAVGAPAEISNIYAVYAATGERTDLELSLGVGNISALRKVEEGTIIQTTAPLSPGSSGGGLFDDNGRLVGITTFKTLGGENINMALPVTWVAEMGVAGASRGAPATVSLTRTVTIPPAAPSGSNRSSTNMVLWLTFLAVGIVLLATSKKLIRWISDALASVPLAKAHKAEASPAPPPKQRSHPIESFYPRASEELNSGDRDEGLWLKLLVESDGNEATARSRYIQARAWELFNQQKEKAWSEAVRKAKAP